MSKSNHKVKAAIFDLGGVVMNIHLQRIADRWACWAPAGCLEKLVVALEHPTFLGFETGHTTPQEFHQFVQGVMECNVGYDEFYAGWNSLFDGTIDGIEPLLSELSAHVKLVALSNTNAIHEQHFRSLYENVLGNFQQLFLSNRLGMRKPQPQIYQHVLKCLDLPAPAVVFIDDTPANVQAAEALGIRSILARSTAQVSQALREMNVPIRMQT